MGTYQETVAVAHSNTQWSSRAQLRELRVSMRGGRQRGQAVIHPWEPGKSTGSGRETRVGSEGGPTLYLIAAGLEFARLGTRQYRYREYDSSQQKTILADERVCCKPL